MPALKHPSRLGLSAEPDRGHPFILGRRCFPLCPRTPESCCTWPKASRVAAALAWTSGPIRRLQGHRHRHPRHRQCLWVRHWAERRGAAAWIAASFGQGRPISQSTGEMPSPRGEGIARQAMVEMLFTQRATAHTAQPDPKRRRKEGKKESMASGACFPPPLPTQENHSPRAVAALACNLHIDGLWLACGMNLFHQTKAWRRKSI